MCGRFPLGLGLQTSNFSQKFCEASYARVAERNLGVPPPRTPPVALHAPTAAATPTESAVPTAPQARCAHSMGHRSIRTNLGLAVLMGAGFAFTTAQALEKRGGGRSLMAPRGDMHPVISVTQITEFIQSSCDLSHRPKRRCLNIICVESSAEMGVPCSAAQSGSSPSSQFLYSGLTLLLVSTT